MRYLYYRLWQFFKQIKTNDMPATNAMIIISICEFANLFVIDILLEFFFHIKLDFPTTNHIYTFAILVGTLVYIINYFFLYKNREKLNDKYKDESKRRKKVGTVLLILYMVVSFALVFYFGPKYTSSILI